MSTLLLMRWCSRKASRCSEQTEAPASSAANKVNHENRIWGSVGCLYYNGSPLPTGILLVILSGSDIIVPVSMPETVYCKMNLAR